MNLSKRFEILQGRRREIGLILGFAIVAGLTLGFGLLTEEVLEGDTEAFDRTVAAAMRSGGDVFDPIGPPWLGEFARDITALGSYAFLGILTFGVIG
jgi:undecaprenyl-diphosphatase